MFRTLFGEFSWRAPPWLQRTRDRLRTGATSIAEHARAKPRQSAVLALVAIAVVLGGFFAWRWWEARPRPELVAYQVNPPTRTCYECLPPGKPNPLIVGFAASAAPLENVGKQLPADDLIRVSPALAGRWTWDDDRTLRFQPDQDWPIGAQYEVTLARDGVIAPSTSVSRTIDSLSALRRSPPRSPAPSSTRIRPSPGTRRPSSA